MNQHYAMMIDLTSRRCLVVGGGPVAERKACSLVEAGANVVVVSLTATPRIKQLALMGQVEWLKRTYRQADGEHCFLVIAATNDKQVNLAVYRDAVARGQWINVVDQPALCNFTVPSTVKRGKLQIAISTSGVSPALAKKIRRELEQSYGDEYSLYLDLMQEVRGWIQQEVSDASLRYQLMKELVSDRWIEQCRTNPEGVRDLMLRWIKKQLSIYTWEGVHHETIGCWNEKK
ncbi:bifunctional precorrin-2 dehydrogenase/sirohydrochlorin ferrochelatase [Paenactinomyces guangxiensis]|uniref:precorrin-2 dehydrogenase n=1 Tax=Paenactinomyces guangxiensis TaxID=1490290 RepID=A0A7W2AA10_9BACL|nr:bifunctional precorrin-2 dehydrogenase/sirohydrochlorin ferrochelatase [Paenactinomyces guangxiensis]MBA4496295.1 bifunctional precorrin-2 dehydrogenase/sirohydrochlorin ferrochelatase [Paenactinomyces guangxiensis]MBH8593348.1 bifunctional precorrin-2 dehydrogenase/sirohydrochlorin ferrochelatase [Paenactinomyces guangxiensis]